ESAAHPGDPSSASALASYGSRQRRRSTTRSSAPPAAVQTSAHAHWLPSLHVPSLLGPPDRGRTSPPPRDAAVDAPRIRLFRSPQKQFVGSPDGSDNLYSSCSAPFSRALVGWHHQSLSG